MLKKILHNIRYKWGYYKYTLYIPIYYSSLCSVLYVVFQFNDNFNLTIYLLPPNHIVKLRTDCI